MVPFRTILAAGCDRGADGVFWLFQLFQLFQSVPLGVPRNLEQLAGGVAL